MGKRKEREKGKRSEALSSKLSQPTQRGKLRGKRKKVGKPTGVRISYARFCSIALFHWVSGEREKKKREEGEKGRGKSSLCAERPSTPGHKGEGGKRKAGVARAREAVYAAFHKSQGEGRGGGKGGERKGFAL